MFFNIHTNLNICHPIYNFVAQGNQEVSWIIYISKIMFSEPKIIVFIRLSYGSVFLSCFKRLHFVNHLLFYENYEFGVGCSQKF